MRILFVARFLPHADSRDSGGQDTYHYIDALAPRHEISLIAFARPQEAPAVATMRTLCRQVVAVPYREEQLGGRLWRAGWRLLLPRVYGRNISLRYLLALRRLMSENTFDVVVVDGMMAPYGRLARGTVRILDEVDVYAPVAYQDYQRARGLARSYAYVDWLRTQRFELRYARRYEAALARSSKDAIYLNSLLPHLPVHVLAPWFEGLESLQQVPAHRPPGNDLLFVGAMQNQKNVDAVTWFVRDVLPLIRRQVADARLHVVGGAPAPEVLALTQQEGVIVTGAVPDLTPYYRQSALNVVPLLTGGGIIVKTLNGMAAARPTVATPAGCAGISAATEEDLLVVPAEARAFAAAVIRVLRDASLWSTLAEGGRRFVRSHYDWEAVITALEGFLQEIRAH